MSRFADCRMPDILEFLCGELKVLMLRETDYLKPVVEEGLLNYY